ncbi:hypothetical protein FKP32DRAFT_1591785 [Trametes sanguinea]|nr:hypothetical protein FKP32DRAFT_1591785 [Trametes sanguinea]
MTSNVALDPGPVDSPLTIMSSPSQASEPSSVASNRVFFGPVRSPEKRFARRAGSAPFRTPVRRSARLSSAMVPLPLFPQHQAAASTSREGTPDEDGVVDEPSVVLASRVLSASGNPSPPPSPPLPSQVESSAFMDVQLLDISESPQPQRTPPASLNGPLIPIEDASEPIAVSSPAVVPDPSIPQPSDLDTGNVSQPDLINFDSFSASHDHDTPTPRQAQDPTRLSAQPSTSTVDDLLSMSPLPVRVEQHDMQATEDGTSSAAEPQSDAASPEEMEVENSLIIEADAPPLPAPTAEHPQSGDDAAFDSVRQCFEESSPPLRRSSRPRKSRSSLPQTIVSSPPPAETVVESAEETADNTEQQRQEESQGSPVRKRKLKALPPLPQIAAGSNIDATTPRRSPRADLIRRNLGSLSPVSAAVLNQLLPRSAGESASRSTTPQPPPQSQEGERAGPSNTVAAPSTPPQQTANLIFPKVGSEVGGGAPDIQRPRSPLRPFPFSPAKLDDTTRTPARRVPIAQAIAEGTYSAQKLPALFSAPRPTAAPGSPVFRRLALDDPARSPAKRVPISEAVFVPPPSSSPGKGKEVARPTSPVRPPTRERQRSGSVEPRPLAGRKERGSSAEPTTRPPALGHRPFFQKPASSDGVPSATKPRSALPFPLVPTQRLHPTVPEADEPGPSALRPPTASATDSATTQLKASPAKAASSLRQSSAGPSSKIPRIGAKPYARPTAMGKREVAASKLPAPGTSRAAPKPLRVVTVGSCSSGGSSDEGHAAPPPKPARRPVPPPSSSEASGAHALKRKREPEPSTVKAATAKPVIVMRKVVPGMFNRGEHAGSSSSTAVEQNATKSFAMASPAKASGPIKARSAVNWKRPQTETQPGPPPPSPVVSAPAALKPPTPEPTPTPAVSDAQPAAEQPTSVKEPELSAPVSSSAPEALASQELPDAGPSMVTTEASKSSSRQHRRSTRSKRSQDDVPTADVFNTVEPAPARAARTSHTRRKPGPFPSEVNGPFAGMSALALKTLTSANTIKNQQQVAVIKTEVIRKEGARPDSPTTKVRTALEKQREERTQQRKERAERRARRSGGDEAGDTSTAGDGQAAAGEAEVDVDASFMSVDRDPEGVPVRHRRGPGDEGDYETPPRPERPAKRLRFDGADAQESEKEKEVPEKRVNPPKPRRNKNAVPSQKGCLAPTAKALRLDTMGNVLNAELPVGGIVRENVVVKKFVFDDDVVPEVASPAPVKSTRSKSKKAKS